MNLPDLLRQGDVLTRGVALVLLAMSVGSWVVMLWKAWLLQRARGDVARSVAAFWQAPSLEDGLRTMAVFDRDALVTPLVQATYGATPGTLAAAGDASQQLTRVLRDALHGVLHRLHSGQVVLASVGATAPFVGLLGTVWGIYHALLGIAGAGPASMDKIAAPVGEALAMTAAGLVVAIPAVVGYNLLGRAMGRLEADLEGFARDVRDLLVSQRGQGRT